MHHDDGHQTKPCHRSEVPTLTWQPGRQQWEASLQLVSTPFFQKEHSAPPHVCMPKMAPDTCVGHRRPGTNYRGFFIYTVRMTALFTITDSFTQGKQPPKNEDKFANTDTALILSDGATDKSGQSFDGRTGGEVASELVVNACLNNEETGEALVELATKAVNDFYRAHNPKALEDSALRISATLVAAKIIDDSLVVTQVGDSAIRINGTDIYDNDAALNIVTAQTRKNYIQATGDVATSRDFIMPLLKAQHVYQNNPDAPIGFGVIDGTPVPAKFVKTYTFLLDQIITIELVSDGYYGAFPAEVSAAAYEAIFSEVEQEDPDKCKKYPSTKTSDDRTVVIAKIQPQE